MQTLTVADLSAILHKSPASIYKDFSRNPGSLPPYIRIPGSRRPLWRAADVDAWLQQFIAGAAKPAPITTPTTPTEPPKRKRGRPTKAEQIEIARAASDK